MENLNAEQIKKALTVHSHIKHPTMVDCSACAYIWSESCQEVLATDALSLINSQEQRIKELEAENRQYYYEQRKLVEARDTYKEYAENMQLFVEKIVHLEDKGYEPYVMIYDKPNAPREIKDLQRWVNNKFIFRSCEKFEDYKKRFYRTYPKYEIIKIEETETNDEKDN